MRQLMFRSVPPAIRRFASFFSSPEPDRKVAALSTPAPERKVAVLEATGPIGSHLALLMKLNPLVSDLALYDNGGSPPSIAEDLNFIDLTRTKVYGYIDHDQIGKALEGSDLVIIPEWAPLNRDITRDQQFLINALVIKEFCVSISKYCPNALVNMIGDGLNSTVPLAAEVFKKAGTYDPKKLFGVTTFDVVTARTLYAEKANVNAVEVNVPVVGGHAGITILPLFSQASPKANTILSEDDIKALTKKTQDGFKVVDIDRVEVSGGSLSLAYAGALFAEACLKGLNGEPDVVECSYVQSSVTDLPYFASKVKLGKNGVEEVYGLGSLSDFEKEGLDNLKAELKSSIEDGIRYANGTELCDLL